MRGAVDRVFRGTGLGLAGFLRIADNVHSGRGSGFGGRTAL
jgi:hypothetical protein